MNFIIILNFISIEAYSFDIPTFIMLSKQQTLFDNIDVIADNVANVDTPGYKGNKLLEKKHPVPYPRTKQNIYNNDISTVRDMTNGDLVNTNNVLDLAIVGKGFFMIETANGLRYTRAGVFLLSNNNEIVTVNGDRLLDQNEGAITLPANAKTITIAKNGAVIVDNNAISIIGIAEIQNLHLLMPEAKTLFRLINNQTHNIANPNSYSIAQGFLESSNVNRVQQLTEMIEVQRDTGLVSGLLNSYDDMGRDVINRLGRN